MGESMVVAEVFNGMDGLDKLKTDWQILLAQHPRPRFYHFFEWWHAYLSTLETAPDSVHFLLFRDCSGPIAIVPVKRRLWRLACIPVRELGFPNHPHMPLQDALYRTGTDLSSLIGTWFRQSSQNAGLPWDLVRLHGILEESPLTARTAQGFKKRKGQACAYFDCTRPYEELLRGLSKNMQANLRKARNRWAKEAEGRFLIVTKPEELEARFLDFLKVESSGWKGLSGSGTAIALHADLTLFYRQILKEFSQTGNVRLYCLELDGEVIAAVFCVSDQDTLYLLKIGYEEKWSRFSPGSLLCEHVLKEATADAAIRYVNWMTDMEWIKTWRPRFYEVSNLILFNSTLVGQLCRVGMSVRQYLARLSTKTDKHAVLPPASAPHENLRF